MSIDRETVKQVSVLARLGLSDQELDALTPELAAIIGYFDTLNSLDLTGIAPTAHLQEPGSSLREDRLTASLPVNKVLENAPDAKGPFFRVQKIIGADDG